MRTDDKFVQFVDGLIVKYRRVIECLLCFEVVDRDNRYVEYARKYLCVFLQKSNIEVPRIIVVPQWYIRLLFIIIGPEPPTGRVEGLTVFDTGTLEKAVYIFNKIDIETIWGSSVVLHELVHINQYVEGRADEPSSVLEFEARFYQKQYLACHDIKVDNSFLIG